MAGGSLTYSVRHAAALLGISPSAYFAALARGEVPGYRVGRRCLVPCTQLHDFIERGPAADDSRSATVAVRGGR